VKGAPLHLVVDIGRQKNEIHSHTISGGSTKDEISVSTNSVSFPMESSPSSMRYCVIFPHLNFVIFFYDRHICGNVMLYMIIDLVVSLLL
jgi:hypothetical protein